MLFMDMRWSRTTQIVNLHPQSSDINSHPIIHLPVIHPTPRRDAKDTPYIHSECYLFRSLRSANFISARYSADGPMDIQRLPSRRRTPAYTHRARSEIFPPLCDFNYSCPIMQYELITVHEPFLEQTCMRIMAVGDDAVSSSVRLSVCAYACLTVSFSFPKGTTSRPTVRYDNEVMLVRL